MIARRLLLVVLGLALLTCTPPRPPTPTPTPDTAPPANEQCATTGQTCGCWDRPPGSDWLWVCCDPYIWVDSPNQCGGTCPPPSPGPTPTPPAEKCRTTSVDYFENILKPHSGQQVDYTVRACGGDVVRTNHNCDAKCCELSSEKGNQACADFLYGMPKWYPSDGISLVQVYDNNTYTQKVVAGTGDHGRVRVCGHSVRTKGNCVKADVVVGVPPCEVPAGSKQGCATNYGEAFNR